MEMNLQKQEIRGRRQDMLNPAFGNGKPFGGGRMGNLIQSGLEGRSATPEAKRCQSFQLSAYYRDIRQAMVGSAPGPRGCTLAADAEGTRPISGVKRKCLLGRFFKPVGRFSTTEPQNSFSIG